ncbi:MAG: flavin reductase family protein [Candidatus Thermoplasmatota archaeon]|jgi:flavin reductase (DIM6/NTAB) family NADH-FMN oxidoreductase RutF|nr:flavin reductase family protein [Candidatus Thermoplasmatota archaeon]MCL5984281.1 flavin reductase family protein [Candidatus Thermoplasmatota archaeon]
MDEALKKQALRMINYGLYVMTSTDGKDVAAGTVNWVSQCSFKPPLVMVGVKGDSHLHALVEKSRRFAVNILADGQKDLANDFFKPTQTSEGTLNGRPYVAGSTGCPLLTDTPASFECRVAEIVHQGDHSVIVGEVVDAHVRKTAEPLHMRTTGWFYGG